MVTNCRIFDLEQNTMGLRDSRFNDPAEEVQDTKNTGHIVGDETLI